MGWARDWIVGSPRREAVPKPGHLYALYTHILCIVHSYTLMPPAGRCGSLGFMILTCGWIWWGSCTLHSINLINLRVNTGLEYPLCQYSEALLSGHPSIVDIYCITDTSEIPTVLHSLQYLSNPWVADTLLLWIMMPFALPLVNLFSKIVHHHCWS